jgi:aryl-alcohol dehydrogenase-like predicted oxidoreductase
MKIAIGTVQFGLNYGIANINGQTSQFEAKKIINTALKYGIDTLDTAAAYGESEKVLGKISIQGFDIITKIPPIPSIDINGTDWVINNIKQSQDRLQVQNIYGILLHNSADMLGPQGKNIAKGLNIAKSEGLTKKIGYSIYDPEILSDLFKILPADIVQAPLNVLDQRLINSGWLNFLSKNGVEVHVRSIFLQGLLLMPPERRPAFFDRWKELFKEWDQLATISTIERIKCCFGFIKKNTEISRVIVGVETENNLKDILTAWHESKPFDAIQFSSSDGLLINPQNWEK